ncbi:MAG: hypothetical protein O2887_11500 [Bacteroidetes bacterium]|nr:hypothetical protein [Bacteroidota bacterium]MDA1121096.1 hypothetical protein [Bacteroidota bacterium]
MRFDFFTEDWRHPHRNIYLILLSLFFGITAIYLFALIRGENNALGWLITSTLDTVEVPLRQFKVGLFEFDIAADNYLITQAYQGSAYKITPFSSYVLLSIFCAMLLVLLTISTYFSRIWYLIFMSAMSFVFVNFQFSQLEIFGWLDNTFLIVVLTLVLPVSYYLHSTSKDISLIIRFCIFVILFGTILLLISVFARVPSPIFYMANLNYSAPLVLSIIFILMVSHEIVYFILFLISGANIQKGKSNLGHFIALSLIYLTNVALVYFRNAKVIDWNIIYINAFFLLLVSSIIGFWGLKQRENQYKNIFPFNPIGGYLYVTLAIICFSTISYHLITANDPVLETFEDAIVFSHIGFGTMFFLYILSNFINLMGKGLSVYKVAYKDANMPYFSANIAGLVLTAVFYYLSNQAALNQAIAGYYNGLGSAYSIEGNTLLAGEYYRRGALFGYNNHRSNYSLGGMAIQQDNIEEAISRLKKAVAKNPTEFAYINLANAQNNANLFFDALFTLRDGYKKFPESEKISNNLGLIFKKTNILDSAVFYLENGVNSDWGGKANAANIIDILARNQLKLPTDSIIRLFRNSESVPVKSNLIAYSNLTGYWLHEPIIIPRDSVLNLQTFALLYNQIFASLRNPQSKTIDFTSAYAKNLDNASFRETLHFIKALALYCNGRITDAFREFDVLQERSSKKGYYNHILGVMALEQNAPKLASIFFSRAKEEKYPGTEVNIAIAQTEAGETTEALEKWERIYTSDSVSAAKDMIFVLTATFSDILEEPNDALKYQVMRYRSSSFDDGALELILNSIEDKGVLTGTLLMLSDKLIRVEEFNQVSTLLEQIRQIDRGSTEIEVSLLANEIQLGRIAAGAMSLLEFDNDSEISTHFKKWQNDGNPESIDYFRSLGFTNPFRESEVLIAASYFSNYLKNHDEAYAILLNAVEINPYSKRLLKAFILECVQVGLANYAKDELIKLYDLAAEREFREFEVILENAITEFDNFEFPILPIEE